GLTEADQQSIFSIPHNRNDADRSRHIWWNIDIGILVLCLCPITTSRVDVESKNGLVLSSFQPLVDSADFRTVGVLTRQQRYVTAPEIRFGDLQAPISCRPRKHSLYIKALANTLLVICCDPIGRCRFDIVDPQSSLDGNFSCHWCITCMATLDFTFMACATI